MKKIRQEVGEIRWRVKGTVGLVALGTVLGALAWVWPALGGEADLVALVRVLAASSGDPYMWTVVSLCAALGGWVGWVFFWRGRQTDEPGGDGGSGMSAPKF